MFRRSLVVTMTLNEKRHDKGYTVKTTAKIRDTLKNKYNQKVHRIPVASPVNLYQDQILLLIHIYLVRCWVMAIFIKKHH